MNADTVPPLREPGLEEIRTAAAMHVRATSLRRTAVEVGVSPTGLSGFLSGKHPQSGTRHKLLHWYVGHVRSELPRVSPAGAQGSLYLLTAHLPDPLGERTRGQVAALVARATEEAALPRPAWMRESVTSGGDGPREP